MKNVLKKALDPYKALVAYRATPLESGLSPAELLMGRKICTTVPILPSQLEPSWPYLEQSREKDSALKAKQMKNFDKRHSAKSLPDLLQGDTVWVPSKKVEGKVTDKAGTPQSYKVATPSGQLRRNRRHLNLLPETPSEMDTVPSGEPCPLCKTDSPVCTTPLVSPGRST